MVIPSHGHQRKVVEGGTQQPFPDPRTKDWHSVGLKGSKGGRCPLCDRSACEWTTTLPGRTAATRGVRCREMQGGLGLQTLVGEDQKGLKEERQSGETALCVGTSVRVQAPSFGVNIHTASVQMCSSSGTCILWRGVRMTQRRPPPAWPGWRLHCTTAPNGGYMRQLAEQPPLKDDKG